ncbi:MAG: flippase [Daejeonella sp.]
MIPGFDEYAFNKYFKNTGWLLLARVGSLGIKILVGFAVANYLGSSSNGILNYPLAFVTFFIAAAALGLDGFLTRELLSNPQNKDKLLGTSFWMRLIAGFAILPLVYFTYLLINHIKSVETPLSYILVVALIGIIQSLNIIDCYFQSRVQAKFVMYVQIAANLISAALKLILIFSGAPLVAFIYALLADAGFLAIGYLITYQSQNNSVFNWKFDFSLAGYLLKHSWPLAFSAILVTIYMKIDQLMVSSYLGSSELGIYSTVVSLSESWYFIPVAIVTSVFPAIMNARRDDPNRYQKRLQDMYDLMVLLSLSIAIIMTFASHFVYHIFYKPEFWPGATVLSVHVWAGVFVFLGSASGQYLIAEGLTKLAMLRTAVGAIVNIALNIIWIPQYGILGAAYATLVAYGVATFFILFIPSARKQGLMMLKSLFLVSLVQKIYKR